MVPRSVILIISLFILSNYHGTHSSPLQRNSGAMPRCTDCKWTQHWELQSRVNISGVLPVMKYQSKRTGLTLVLAQADSPIVNGYFCLATEAWTNEGLPHTLEHLIFLGR